MPLPPSAINKMVASSANYTTTRRQIEAQISSESRSENTNGLNAALSNKSDEGNVVTRGVPFRRTVTAPLPELPSLRLRPPVHPPTSNRPNVKSLPSSRHRSAYQEYLATKETLIGGTSGNVVARLSSTTSSQSLTPSKSSTTCTKHSLYIPVSRSPSPSPCSSLSLDTTSRGVSVSSTKSWRSSYDSTTPRRFFPQSFDSRRSLDLEMHEMRTMEQSPVIFEGNMSFILDGSSQQVRQKVKPLPAHQEPKTASCRLTAQIDDFLKRTDHVMQEWKGLGRREGGLASALEGPSASRLGRSRSAQNILVRGFLRSPSVTRDRSRAPSEAGTISEAEELSEMTADLADEHSTATLATERLEREEQERVRLERELQQAQDKNRGLQQTSERLEMELLYARSDLNGSTGTHSDSEDGNGEPEAYRRRYERAQRELEFTRRRLQQQHEDDLEQLVGLKKQLEKKLSDAYEEVEEQRQVAGQWKRKAQKLTAEQNDLRLLLEQRGARNALLEKRQRRHESELQHAAEELRSEKTQKERAQRERDVAIAERDGAEQSWQDARLELDLKEERLQALRLELESGSGGAGAAGGRVDEELAALRKIRTELEHKTRDQEEELDDLAGQVQLLEQHKLRLEMMLENVRKEGRHEAQQRDEELEETRANAQKKVRALEAQLESEHAERTLLLRERHELERRLAAAEEEARGDGRARAEQVQRARRELKRTKALLRDAQAQLERQRQEAPARSQLRSLRNQLEDAEAARAAACKARAQLDLEAREAQQALEEATRAKSEADQRLAQATRERAELRGQLDENEEELAEVMKKYRAAVQQLGTEQRALAEHASKLQDAERKIVLLQETVAELTARLEAAETLGDAHDALALKRMELRVKELESKLEMEQTARGRLEVQVNRHREALERATTEASQAQSREQLAQDTCRKLQRAHRELREEHQTLVAREAESAIRRKDAEKRLEACEAEAASARSDLRLALQRIEDLQAAMLEEDMDGDGGSNEDGSDDSDQDSSGTDESLDTFLANNKLGGITPTNEKPTVRVSPRQTQTSHDTTSPRIRVSASSPTTSPYAKENNSSFA